MGCSARVPKVLLEAMGAREEPGGRGTQETPMEPWGARQLSQGMRHPAPGQGLGSHLGTTVQRPEDAPGNCSMETPKGQALGTRCPQNQGQRTG